MRSDATMFDVPMDHLDLVISRADEYNPALLLSALQVVAAPQPVPAA